MQRTRAARAAGLGLLGALALAGCASAPDDAGEAWQQARTQLDEADSLRLTTATTAGQGSPEVIRWELSGQPHGEDSTSAITRSVGEDSTLTQEYRTVGGEAYAGIHAAGPNVPAQIQQMYGSGEWSKVEEGQSVANLLRQTLDQIALPAADALDGVDAEPEEVEWSGGTAHRFEVPADVADAAAADGTKTERLRSFTVDADGTLVGLRVQGEAAEREFTLSDWNSVEPAEVPEEVAK